jgi:hypothetical protein
MNAEPISKELFDKLIAAGVNEVTLRFSGGSDEGYLDVDLDSDLDNADEAVRKLTTEVEKWAWDVYAYNGAGEGIDYGDDIVYDLVNKKVKLSEWCYERTERDRDDVDLEIAE